MCLQEKRAKDTLFSTEETLSILLSILDSLCQLHANGIIHGEINPEYIFWHEPDEKAMLLGLGTFKNSRFSTSKILNKGGYSAPEQQNGELQEQSDLYALGMLGLCLLTGIPADDFSIIDGQLDLTDAQAGIFMPVFNWLKQAVELNTENRFKTALEMREKLGDFYEMIIGEELPPITIQIIPLGGNPPPEKNFYVNFTEKGYSWEDWQEYGFIAGGGGKWFNRTLKIYQ
jgi:serine/threonine protein kinase